MVRNSRVNPPQDHTKNNSICLSCQLQNTTTDPCKSTRHKIYPEVQPHHKGVLLPIEELTKGRVFFNPNPPEPDHKGQGKSFLKSTHKRGWYKLLGVVQKFGDSQATSIHQGSRRFQEQQVHTRGVCNMLKRWERERGEENQIRKSQAQT
jgi:hypothetical protein